MKRSFLPALVLISVLSLPVVAQNKLPAGAQLHLAPPPEAICTLHATGEHVGHSVARPAASQTGAASVVFSVNFLDAAAEDPWPEDAKTAFLAALDIWSTHIESAVTIFVDATWASFGGCDITDGVTLGAAGPTFFISDFGAGEADTFYPIAQVEAIIGSNFVPGSADIVARFNRACDDPGSDLWYFGVDANPGANQVDFVSVVLHEIGHGLGFTGTADWDDGAGSGGAIECDGTAGNGCFSDPPGIYDRFATNAASTGSPLLSAGFPANSATLGNAFLGLSGGGVFFDGPSTRYATGAGAARLFAPAEWDGGSSFSHLDEATFNGTADALMTPSLGNDEAVHAIGAVTCGILEDMGWPLTDACLDLLPVELVAFDGVVDGAEVRLHWETAGETNSAGFAVEHAAAGDDFVRIGFVAGAGTTSDPLRYSFLIPGLEPGRHRFRLRQVDFDGAFAYSATIEREVRTTTPYAISAPFPNPFNPHTQFTVAVQSAQHVRIAVYNVLGARVLDLHDAALDAHQAHRFTVDAAGLPSGVYLVGVEGESFRDWQAITLMK
ncbi:MAG: T9SS type A sorting domain-containing protein [Rhodothermales bacterium]|nr:T9SS type A sorting domain-containing protein [Rhodothermales bacterium]